MNRVYFLLVLIILLSFRVYSQVTITGDTTLCLGESTTLTATTTGISYGTLNYVFEFIDYSAHPDFSGGTIVDPSFTSCNQNYDDCFAPANVGMGPYGFPIGFSFCFFNQFYDRFWVGSNGWVGFTNPTGHTWTTYVAAPIPNTVATVPKNCIFAPWQDWYPGVFPAIKNVYYYNSGTAPNRKLVVYWKDCPLYNCTSATTIIGTFMIVLNEQSSIIENFIQNKPQCTGFGATEGATQGVINLSGDVAYTALNRNYQVWTTTNEGTRFKPSGITWYKDAYPGGTQIGYGETLTVTPAITTTYFAVVGNCDGTTPVGQVTVTVNPRPTPTFVSGSASACQNDVKTYKTESTGVLYTWGYTGTLVAGGGPADDSVTIQWGTTGPNSVSVNYTNGFGCQALTPVVLPVTVNLFEAPVITTIANEFCGETQVTFTTQAGKLNYIWDYLSSGATLVSGGTSGDNTIVLKWTTPGLKTISVNYTDAGCTGSSPVTKQVTIKPVPVLNGPFTKSICTGDNTSITLSSSPAGADFGWNTPAPLCSSNILSCPAGAATGTTISDVLALTDNLPGSVAYHIIPAMDGCPGTPQDIIVDVHPLPIPVIEGEISVCPGIANKTYACQPGKTNYFWSVPPEATVIAGGTTADNFVTVTWNSVGTFIISVNYSEPVTLCTAISPATLTVTVNPPPAPVLGGESPVCLGIAGNTYTTQSGKTNYLWTIPPQATITAGGTTNDDLVTLTWNTVGTYTIAVNFSEPGTLCTSALPTPYAVTVNPLPVPLISGPNFVCPGIAGKTYTCQPGKLNYLWNVPPEATITAGGTGTDNFVTVTWITVGTFNLTVNFTEPVNMCMAVSLTPYSVTVNPLPVPVISGENSVCPNIPGKTYTCQPGKSNYTWTIPPQATVTAGGNNTSDYVTLTWTTTGTFDVGVNYTEPGTLCTAIAPTLYAVTVNALPTPTITGPDASCLNFSATYSTEDLQSGYQWNVVSGGNITSGQSTKQVNVLWNTLGTHDITVNYVDQHGCTAISPTSRQVVVNSLPIPAISGANIFCASEIKTYQTQTGAQSYSWGLPSSGVTVISGGGVSDDQVTIEWDVANAYNISVNYVIGTGCTAAVPTNYPVTVHANPSPVISGPNPVCALSTQNYTLAPIVGGHLYNWTVTGGSIQSGQYTNTVHVFWENLFSGSVDLTETINYAGISCSTAATSYPIVLSQWPVAATGSITGSASVCKTSTVTYSISPIPNAVSHQWLYSGTGVTINNNGNATITITFSSTATSGALLVKGSNGCGDGPWSLPLDIVVHNLPEVSLTPCFDLFTTPNAKKIILRGGIPWLAGQGVFSGNRVSLNAISGLYEFDPFGASAGNYSITYSFTNTFGCLAAAAAVNINVQNASFSCGGELTDIRDGKTYKTAWLSGKCWMTQNLAYGTDLVSPGPLQTDNCIPEKYCSPADVNCTQFGGMYQWDELMDYTVTPGTKGICPPEWHVPTENEWQQLIDNLVPGITAPNANGTIASYLKDPLLINGFHALLGGMNYLDNSWYFYSGSSTATMYWTSMMNGPDRATARGSNVFTPSISKYISGRGNAFSARCVKD